MLILVFPGLAIKRTVSHMSERPVVIGHRGSCYGVENTIDAMHAGMEAGAEILELDVVLSADGVPVVCHDNNLLRLAGIDINISDTPCGQLTGLPLSQNQSRSRLMTLEQALAYNGGRARLLIEIKKTDKPLQYKKEMVDKVISIAQSGDYMHSCIFMSQCEQTAEYLAAEYPQATTGYCLYGEGGPPFERLLRMGLDFIILEKSHAGNKVIDKFRQAGLPVYVCTVNDEDSILKYLSMGASGVVTDFPDKAVGVINEYYN